MAKDLLDKQPFEVIDKLKSGEIKIKNNGKVEKFNDDIKIQEIVKGCAIEEWKEASGIKYKLHTQFDVFGPFFEKRFDRKSKKYYFLEEYTGVLKNNSGYQMLVFDNKTKKVTKANYSFAYIFKNKIIGLKDQESNKRIVKILRGENYILFKGENTNTIKIWGEEDYILFKGESKNIILEHSELRKGLYSEYLRLDKDKEYYAKIISGSLIVIQSNMIYFDDKINPFVFFLYLFGVSASINKDKFYQNSFVKLISQYFNKTKSYLKELSLLWPLIIFIAACVFYLFIILHSIDLAFFQFSSKSTILFVFIVLGLISRYLVSFVNTTFFLDKLTENNKIVLSLTILFGILIGFFGYLNEQLFLNYFWLMFGFIFSIIMLILFLVKFIQYKFFNKTRYEYYMKHLLDGFTKI